MSAERPGGKSILDIVTSTAQEILLRDGYHIPTLIVMGRERTTTIHISGDLDHYKDRAAVMRLLGAELRATQNLGELQQVVLINEGWVSKPDPERPDNPLPSQDPMRKEVLVVAMIDLQHKENHLLLFEMLRDPAGELRDLLALQTGQQEGTVRPYLLEQFVHAYQTVPNAGPN